MRQSRLPLLADMPQKRQYGRTFAVPIRIADIMSLHTLQKILPFCRFVVFTATRQKSLPRLADMPQKRQCGRTFAVSCRLSNIMSLLTLKKLLPFRRFYGNTAKQFAPPCRYAAKTEIRENLRLAHPNCRYHKPSHSSKKNAVLPFCIFTTIWQNSLLRLSDML